MMPVGDVSDRLEDLMKSASSLILIAHGSKDPRWRKPFERLVGSLKSDLGENGVFLSYMEFAEPTLMDATAKAVNAGAKKVKVLPLFMAGGAHVDQDIPPQVEAIKKKFPDLNVELLSPIGEHPKFVELICQVASQFA